MNLSSGEERAGRHAAALNKLMEMLGKVYLLQDKAWEDIEMIVVRGTEGHDEPESHQEASAPAKGVLEYQGEIAKPYRGILVLRFWRDDYLRFLKDLLPQEKQSLWRLLEDWIDDSRSHSYPMPIYSRKTQNGKYNLDISLPRWITDYQLGLIERLYSSCCTVKWYDNKPNVNRLRHVS